MGKWLHRPGNYGMLKEKGGMDMKYAKHLALLLVVAILLTGCNLSKLKDVLGDISAQAATPFSEMEYVRPDLEKMETAVESCCEAAANAKNADKLLDRVWEVYGYYDSFYTQYNLAYIYYCKDMTDAAWEEEYSFCMQNAGSVEALLEEMLYALADSPVKNDLEKNEAFGEGFFDAYAGETLWDETFLALMEEEAALQDEYYDLCAQTQDVDYYSDAFFEGYGQEMAQVFVELVALRQEIADYAGYADYPSFAYDFYHYRDYTPEQSAAYLEEICRELVPLYYEVEASGGPVGGEKLCKEAEVYAYVKSCAKNMGSTIYNAFKLMDEAELYDLTYSEKKYDGSFELYLTDYAVPYVFVNPSATQWDKLTFVHEFGHFCNDYATGGIIGGVDVAEVFSQGMEYLSLCYAENGGNLEQIKMVDSLRIFVEQAAYALFEQRVYELEGDELTAQNVYALYEEVGTAFGFDAWDWDSRDFVLIGHFYTDPMYIISYVVSNDAAFQLYQMELEEKGAGLELYEKELTSGETYFLAFLKEAGLESPFAKGRVKEVRKTLEAVLG